jgi:hypothetical protein
MGKQVNKISLYIGAVIICTVLLFLFLRKSVDENNGRGLVKDPKTVEDVGRSDPRENKGGSGLGNNKELSGRRFTEKEALAKIYADPVLKKKYEFAQANVHDIEFYGKVVDQNGDPVQGVKILCGAGGGPLGGGSGYIRLTTDEQGVFRISEKEGHSLQIQKMEKTGSSGDSI